MEFICIDANVGNVEKEVLKECYLKTLNVVRTLNVKKDGGLTLTPIRFRKLLEQYNAVDRFCFENNIVDSKVRDFMLCGKLNIYFGIDNAKYVKKLVKKLSFLNGNTDDLYFLIEKYGDKFLKKYYVAIDSEK